MKDALGHGSDSQGGGQGSAQDRTALGSNPHEIAAQHGISTAHLKSPLAPHELEATQLRGGQYAVRPKGALGTMGWHPRAWTMVTTKARSPADAIRKVGHKV